MNEIAQHFAGKPLAIRPESLSALLQANAMAPSASRFVGVQQGGAPYRMTDGGTAVITIAGALINRAAILGEHWGISSYEGLGHKIGTAGRDPKVHAIILDLDSPGGEAIGAFEAAALIRAVDQAKPVFAIANGMAASAAYALASGCRAIIATPSAIVGSIGVVALHADFSRALDKAGITPTFIHAGAHKVDGNPYAPLSAEVRADLQAEIDRFYSLFLTAVEAGRGDRLTAEAARKTEARTYIGADAQRVGLVDEIGTFAELLGEAEKISNRRAAPRHSTGAQSVDLSKFAAFGGSAVDPTERKLFGAPSNDRPAPPKNEAADWGDIAAEISRRPGASPIRSRGAADADAEIQALRSEADRKPAQAGAVPWAEIAAQLNAEARSGRGK